MRLRSASCQISILGVIFLFIFTAYSTIQGFASQLYGEALASEMESTLYATFTLACFVAPAVTNTLGPRLTLFLGALGYAALVAASLLLAIVGAPWCRGVVVLGGGVLGVGAALLWTAQGRLMLEYSDGTDQGRLFAIFWALFNCSSVVGGLLTFFYFSHHSEEATLGQAPVSLYLIFLGCIAARGGSTWEGEAKATLRLFGTRRMAVLFPLFWYTGFNQPCQLHAAGDVLGAALAGWTLDTASTPRAGALRQLAAFGLATSAAYALALSVEVQAYAYWLLRQLHSGGGGSRALRGCGDELARAVGFYKMVQSLGWSVGFLLVPSWRLPPLVQNLATAACGALGLALALRELPPARIDSRSSSPLLRVVRIEGERVDESAVESAGGFILVVGRLP
ncbi:hypothetical protein EMIHUDRAFT_216767 [Emiliania huxleyi CCMP1516]|uniref:Uncharacterized protein n=2 Tax=Emiliania huxleyi TaxID=2903 RepID=A0A0D3ICI4_EMIH1|nr:hypothetical protein EMIHUDRAFT_216767 [Emiliania huxleyi CCMP1516]EOD08969.1 hypothetical protein EMIHUDRAFT_216767 [Emiliania huxleyi CCMP1516]|eukprot:XP_005761398.1 hypothetical protein EMIHUDRAFT_216767 [Emiliania huxleyi CCMP1516]